MRILITDASGMLRNDLQAVFAGHDIVASSRADLDVIDLDAVRRAVAGIDVIINAAAFTRVDEAEMSEEAAYTGNALGAKHLAVAAVENGAKLVQVSTAMCSMGPRPRRTPRIRPGIGSPRTAGQGQPGRTSCSPSIPTVPH